MGVDAKIQYIIHFFVQYFFRKAERGDLAAHHSPAGNLLIEQMDLIPLRGKVSGYSKRCRPASDKRNLLSIGWERCLWHVLAYIVFIVCSHPFQSANGDGFFFHPASSTGGFTRPVTSSAKDSWKNIGFPVDHISFAVFLRRYQTDIFRDWRVGWAGILAIHHFVVIFRILNIGRFHDYLG